MELFVQKFAAASIESMDPPKAMSRKRLNSLLSASKTRNDIRKELFFQRMRFVVDSPNFDVPPEGWSRTATERAVDDYLRRLTPFILAEFAHLASAFLVDTGLLVQFCGQEVTPAESDAAEEVLRRRPSAYIEFPALAVGCSDGRHLRAVVITQTTATRSKWSAALEPTADKTGSCILTWYVENGVAASFENVIHTSSNSPGEGGWSQLAASVTGLVHKFIAAWAATPAGVMSRWNPQSQNAEPLRSINNSSKTTIETVDVAGCAFRVQRLTARIRRASADGRRGAGWKLARHIKVEGYWKTVACEKGRLERRKVWIPSHHKGPRHLPLSTRFPLFNMRTGTNHR